MIYTKLGDNGFTSTLTQKHILKNNKIFDVLGTFDEVNASIALVKLYICDNDIQKHINNIQKDIILISSIISGSNETINYKDKISFLENNIDKYEKLLPKNDNFIVFGNEKISTLFNQTRTIIRRLERNLINLKQLNFMFKIDDLLYAWVNRLSDFIFVMSRYYLIINSNDNKILDSKVNNKNIVINNNQNYVSKIQKINSEILKKAQEINVNIVIAICDSGGNIISVLRDKKAFIASIDIAINKAYTSVVLKMSTEKLSKLSSPTSELNGIQYTNNGRIINLGGGLPIYNKDKDIIFGLGVSGGNIKEDILIAEYGYKKFMEEFML